ncbi:MAG: hypothetical protein KAR06_04550, partial [Deltaproteobacteria bacterium]|nr:hypothetical protein [Deltaproteobacteria bacterium]
GSDWFWWYGDDHHSETGDIFDHLFRENIKIIYKKIDKPLPEGIDEPIIKVKHLENVVVAPPSFMFPVIDGVVNNYTEWVSSTKYTAVSSFSSMHSSLIDDELLSDSGINVDTVNIGFNADNLFIKVASSDAYIDKTNQFKMIIRINQPVSKEIIFNIDLTDDSEKNTIECNDPSIVTAISEVIELSVPFESFNVTAGDLLEFKLSFVNDEGQTQVLPSSSRFEVTVPNRDYEEVNWVV